MGDRLKDQGAVVTGAGRGIGREIALALADEGAKVIAVDPGVSRSGEGFDVAPADETVAEIKKRGGTAIANYSSVADFKACEGIIKSCVENFGRLDILANFAGIARQGMVWELSEEDWDIVMRVHVYGTFNTTRWASGIMKEQRRGRIINATGIGAFEGFPDNSNYNTAKGAIVTFTWSVARELGGYGVTCNALSPGAATRIADDKAGTIQMLNRYLEIGAITKEIYEEQLPQIGLPHTGGPEHISPIVVYLCTDEASNINGKIFTARMGSIGIYNEPQLAKQIFNNGEMWTIEQLIDIVPNKLLSNPRGPFGIKSRLDT